uniref:Putative wd repeat and hmg-box dna-binding protein 1 n=1 Tax=Xenopsylla cheopis TaxID=163159 RepID=A0A6M2DXS0_XENCH
MACLSSTVLALACETPSKLVCITLGASGREWTTEMSQDEEILAIGAGEKLVAVATDNRSLRLFTAYGTQREIIAIPGPVVCLAGHGDKMLVAYHNTSALIGDDQNISLMFLQAIGMKLKCIHMNLPLGPGAKLTWLGFTDKGSPAFFDSLGVLKIYNTSYGVWMPLCNTASHVKGVSDRFFIIEVSETKQVLYAVLCRGSSYPQTVPRPAVAELPLEFPMCEMETDKSRFEEQLCRWSLWNADPNEKQFKEIAVKLFALACRSELEQRAQELIELIGSRDLLDLAIKYASRLGRMHLADRLTTMAKTIEERPKTPLTHVDHSNDISVDINTPITFNSSLINRTEERTTPIITPLAVKQSQNRNPFKRSLATNFGTPSPLQHLTDKVMGFKNSPTFTPEFTAETKTSESAGEISEKFPDWFEREKANLANEYPNKTTEELTKIALKLYKSRGNKRKLSDEQENLPTNTKQSKLSAFAYTKS